MRKRVTSGQAEGVELAAGGYVKGVLLQRDRVPSFGQFPFSIPAVRGLSPLSLHPRVTFLVGENGSGKSTLIEAVAQAAGFDPEGGSKNFNVLTRRYESPLGSALRLIRGVRREKDGYFLRAESFFNIATQVDELQKERPSQRFLDLYGGRSPHQQSHGESFLALATNRFAGEGLYILDEPEAALSPARQLAFLKLLHHQVHQLDSQFLIATHSPIIMGYPDATIYLLSDDGIAEVAYEETEHFQITSGFLARRESYLHHLLDE